MTKEEIEDKLKFTKITSDSLYHFKYDGVDYVLFNGGDEEYNTYMLLYKGRQKCHLEWLVQVLVSESEQDIIKYKHNKRTLSSIDKEYFIEHLPREIKEILIKGGD